MISNVYDEIVMNIKNRKHIVMLLIAFIVLWLFGVLTSSHSKHSIRPSPSPTTRDTKSLAIPISAAYTDDKTDNPSSFENEIDEVHEKVVKPKYLDNSIPDVPIIPRNTTQRVYFFSNWPHRRVFDGYLHEGVWVAGDVEYITSRLKGMPESLDDYDYIQKMAIKEGIFFPNISKSKIHIFSSLEANECIEGKRILFFGDSYSQQTFIGFGDVLINKPSNFEILNGSVRYKIINEMSEKIEKHLHERAIVKTVIEPCRHSDIQCVLTSIEQDATLLKADAFIGNILVHHMTMHQNESEYQTRYLQQLEELFHRRLKLRLTWATGPSYAINRVPEQYRNETESRPTEYMNFKAIDLAVKYNVPLLDFFSVTHACKWKNCTSDGGHRSRFVNRMKAQMILNNICKLKV